METPIPLLMLNKPSAFLTELSLTQTLFSAQLYRQIGISSLMIEQFQRLLQAAKNDVLYQTRTLYFQVALDHKKVKTAQEHIDLLNYLAERMQGKFNIGEATAYNVNQARVAVANVTDAYYQTVKMLKTHEDEFSKILGYDPVDSPLTFSQEDIDVLQVPELAVKVKAAEALFQEDKILKTAFSTMQDKIINKVFNSEEFTKWNLYADAHRPDILLSQTNVQLAEETVKLKRSEYWPTVSILGNYGGAMTPYLFQPSTQFNNQVFQWAIGFSVNWTIFDGEEEKEGSVRPKPRQGRLNTQRKRSHKLPIPTYANNSIACKNRWLSTSLQRPITNSLRRLSSRQKASLTLGSRQFTTTSSQSMG